jgi:hypothetical protein
VPTLIDEYGDTGILQPPYENRRTSDGERLGPRPRHDTRSYDERQLERKELESLTDIAGALIDGP